MRGKDQVILLLCAMDRITPAYAGKRIKKMETQAGDEDHPRLCGEKYIITSTGSIIPGSPPPMRGKV